MPEPLLVVVVALAEYRKYPNYERVLDAVRESVQKNLEMRGFTGINIQVTTK